MNVKTCKPVTYNQYSAFAKDKTWASNWLVRRQNFGTIPLHGYVMIQCIYFINFLFYSFAVLQCEFQIIGPSLKTTHSQHHVVHISLINRKLKF